MYENLYTSIFCVSFNILIIFYEPEKGKSWYLSFEWHFFLLKLKTKQGKLGLYRYNIGNLCQQRTTTSFVVTINIKEELIDRYSYMELTKSTCTIKMTGTRSLYLISTSTQCLNMITRNRVLIFQLHQLNQILTFM